MCIQIIYFLSRNNPYFLKSLSLYQNRSGKMKWHLGQLSPLKNSIAASRSSLFTGHQDSMSRPFQAKAMRKKRAKDSEVVRWGTWRLHDARHTCACPSLSFPLSHSHLSCSVFSCSYYFSFLCTPLQTRQSTSSLFFCLCAVLYRVSSTRCQTTTHEHHCEIKE